MMRVLRLDSDASNVPMRVTLHAQLNKTMAEYNKFNLVNCSKLNLLYSPMILKPFN